MHTQSITHNHRTAFVLAIDGSGSMSETVCFHGQTMTKAEAVAAVTNGLLFELIERARRSDGVRDYYDIGVIGYWGDNQVEQLLAGSDELISVCKLAAQQPQMRTEVVEYRLPDGSISLREIPSPEWIEPHAAGQTPMHDALHYVYELLWAWTTRPENADSFPPVVFNITDGEATDCDQRELCAICEKIKSLHTTDGNVLLINIHIAAGDTSCGVFFPSEEQTDYPNRYAQLLYRCSSQMPAAFDDAIREAKGPGALPPFRGMSYNASVTELVALLNIGSISIKTE